MEDHLSPQNTMNFDLNLPAVLHPQNSQSEAMSFDHWLIGSMGEVVSNRTTVTHQVPPLSRLIPVPIGGSAATAAASEPPPELIKTTENRNKKDVDEPSFFDCNICLDLASDPVVTCCGHLFCWPCIYRWLFVHSHTNKCPICKGEVTYKTITPIYTRENQNQNQNQTRVTNTVDPKVKIPSRPPANRIESWRQLIQRDTLNFPMLETIRRLDNRFDLNRDTVPNNVEEIPSTLLLNRIFTSRGIRSGRDTVPATSPDGTVDSRNRDDLTIPSNPIIPNLASAESFVESYFRDHPDEMNQEDEIPLIERHSMSSVAAIMHSETDSRVSVSMNSTSRVLDVDSENSRSQRRRLH